MTDFKRNVERYIKVHKQMHGSFFNMEAVAIDLKNSFGYNTKFSLQELERQTNEEYGLFLGRCQPYTNGHDETPQDIIRDGRIPIFVLGSIDKHNDRNPLTFEERKALIELIYPTGVIIVGLADKENWEDWYNSLKALLVSLGVTKEQLTLYSHTKAIDNTDFEYKGVKYENESYTKMFSENGVKIKHLDEVVCSLGQTIHASDVRNNENVAIRNLDARIYRELKDIYGWWK